MIVIVFCFVIVMCIAVIVSVILLMVSVVITDCVIVMVLVTVTSFIVFIVADLKVNSSNRMFFSLRVRVSPGPVRSASPMSSQKAPNMPLP